MATNDEFIQFINRQINLFYSNDFIHCKFCSDRLSRHGSLNKTVSQGLETVDFPNILEPVTIRRLDGKRPGGVCRESQTKKTQSLRRTEEKLLFLHSSVL